MLLILATLANDLDNVYNVHAFALLILYYRILYTMLRQLQPANNCSVVKVERITGLVWMHS